MKDNGKSPETNKEQQLTNGLILTGLTCPWGNDCAYEVACDGKGCPVAYGKIHDKDFSCGTARFFDQSGRGVD